MKTIKIHYSSRPYAAFYLTFKINNRSFPEELVHSVIYDDKLNVFKEKQLSEKKRCINAFFNDCLKNKIDYCVEEYSRGNLFSRTFYNDKHQIHNYAGPAVLVKNLIHKDKNIYYVDGKYIGEDLNIWSEDHFKNYLLLL